MFKSRRNRKWQQIRGVELVVEATTEATIGEHCRGHGDHSMPFWIESFFTHRRLRLLLIRSATSSNRTKEMEDIEMGDWETFLYLADSLFPQPMNHAYPSFVSCSCVVHEIVVTTRSRPVCVSFRRPIFEVGRDDFSWRVIPLEGALGR